MPLWIPTSGCAIDSHQLIAAAILLSPQRSCGTGGFSEEADAAGLVAVLGFAPVFALAQAQAEENATWSNAPARSAPRGHARGSDVPGAGNWGQDAGQTLLEEELASSGDTERIAETVRIATPHNQRRGRIVGRMMRSAPAMLRRIRLSVQRCETPQVSVCFCRCDPPLKRDTARARHREQVAVPGGLRGVGSHSVVTGGGRG